MNQVNHMMETWFSKVDIEIKKRCELKSKMLFVSIFCLIHGALVGALLQAMIPLSDEELAIRRRSYPTKQHPERRHPAGYGFPFIDESESWAFEIIFFLWVHNASMLACITTSNFCVIPIAFIHIKGQYEILVKFIENLGKQQFTNEAGREIFYTNIVTNEFCFVPVNDKQGRKFDKKTLELRQKYIEQQYFKQIVQFHQKMLIIHGVVCI